MNGECHNHFHLSTIANETLLIVPLCGKAGLKYGLQIPDQYEKPVTTETENSKIHKSLIDTSDSMLVIKKWTCQWIG